MAYAVLLTSLPDRAAARAMAQALIAKRLVACAQMVPIESIYEWQGAVEEAAETLLLCKMKRENYAEAERLILAQHSYETPEVVLLPIEAGSSAYLAWIDRVTK